MASGRRAKPSNAHGYSTMNTEAEIARSEVNKEMVLVTVMSNESAKAQKALFEKFELLERYLTRCGLVRRGGTSME
jgi:hypothetical protein